MVLGLLLRDEEERRVVFDFEALLPDEVMDDRDDGSALSMKKDMKRGTVVCRHWLRGLCMKGDGCEFLHQYDMSKMPECRWGMECQVPECPFRHVPDEERVECAFYRQGFCSHGPNCRYRHIKLARDECPETADFSLQSKVADEENIKRRKAQPVNEFYKISICKHWEKLGSCPFGDDCHFAHGETELRPFPREGEEGHVPGNERGGPSLHGMDRGNGGFNEGHGHARGAPNGANPSAMEIVPNANEAAASTAPPLLVLPDEGKFAKYFLLQVFSYQNLAQGVHHSQWTVPPSVQQALKLASETSDDVFVFVTVTSSQHFQGVARLPAGALVNVSEGASDDLSSALVPYETKERPQWQGAFPVDWLRICECPWDRLLQFEKQDLAVAECVNGVELDAAVGHSIMRLIYNQPPIQLHARAVEDESRLAGGALELANRRREAAESIFGPPPPKWRATVAGFICTCTTATIDECFGRLLFGLGKEHEGVATSHISVGTPLFLLNASDHHVLGVFEARSAATLNIVPQAFSQGPSAPSSLPVQVRFDVVLPAPAIPAVDPQMQSIFADRGVQVGPISLEATQRLIDAFADRGAALASGHAPNGPPPPRMNAGMPPMDGAGPSGSSMGGDRGTDAHAGPSTFRRPSREPSGGPLLEKMLVGIDPEHEFGVTRRIIGPAGSHMKRISQEAGGGAKIKVRGRGSGSKESTEDEANEPLMIIVSAENDRSFRIACDLTAQLLHNIHRDYQAFLQRQQRHGGGHQHGGGPPPPPYRGSNGGGYGVPPPQHLGPPFGH